MADELEPEELWRWFGEFHWRHWHGVWINWQASSSPQVARKYHSIRSLQSRADDGSVVFHRNDWYDPSGGSERKMTPKSWLINRQEHCAVDGIIHPAVPNSRTLVFPNGDLLWLPMEIDFPQRPVISEVFFMLPAKNARVAVVVSYNTDGSVAASQLLEEALDSDDRPDESWQGNLWNHDRASVPLESTREEPAGRFVGEETTIHLNPAGLTISTNKAAIWHGFEGARSIHLPYGFSACGPAEATKAFACAVHWAMSHREVRTIAWQFSANGKLDKVKSAAYSLVE